MMDIIQQQLMFMFLKCCDGTFMSIFANYLAYELQSKKQKAKSKKQKEKGGRDSIAVVLNCRSTPLVTLLVCMIE